MQGDGFFTYGMISGGCPLPGSQYLSTRQGKKMADGFSEKQHFTSVFSP
jgi:hypothetical protein